MFPRPLQADPSLVPHVFPPCARLLLPVCSDLAGRSLDFSASPALANPDSLEPWFGELKAVLTKPLPQAGTGLKPRDQPSRKEERNT